MKKLNDYEKEEQDKIHQEINAAAVDIGYERYEVSNVILQRSNRMKHLFGLCSDCKEVRVCFFEYGDIWAICDIFRKELKANNRVTDCTMYDKIGVMDIDTMKEIATIIDTKNRRAGLI